MANIIYCPEKSIFEHDSNTWLVNPVNCVGVMGKGLALEFKKRYPEMFERYVNMCTSFYRVDTIRLGIPQFIRLENREQIILFPTKQHWKDKSYLDSIVSGLQYLLKKGDWTFHSTNIAFPKLGCGLGGLDWKEVHEYIRAFALLCPCETIYIHGENPNG